MEHASSSLGELDLKSAIRVLRRTGNGRESDALQIGVLLPELESWLADERQWRQGEARHWRSLIEDVLDRLHALEALSSPPIQGRLGDAAEELAGLKRGFQSGADAPDEALRRQLRRICDVIRSEITNPKLVVMAWKRIIDWAESDPERVLDGAGALRDLAELTGHDPDELFDRVDRVLADNAWEIAGVTGGPVPDNPRERAGATAESRLGYAVSVLSAAPRRCCGVVWLEYLQAELHPPWMLSFGPNVVLYEDDLLRSLVRKDPHDDRLPEDLRHKDAKDLSLIWFHAYGDEDTPGRQDPERTGDPRVYLRLQLPEMPPQQLLKQARETAEFLVAYGALANDNHDTWVLSDSYLVRDWKSSTSAPTVNPERAERQMASDDTAMELARHADALGRHLPLSTPELRTAGRLVVWLRQASAAHNPAQVVLCERVIEQVCGWAGIAKPWRFTEDSLKPEWIYNRVWNSILSSYRRLRFSPLGQHELWGVIEPAMPQPPHAPRNYLGPTNLKAILENIDDLAKLAEGLDQGVDIQRLRERIADRNSVSGWLHELGEEFDRRNNRLRRTRNALMHGGPITPDTVNHASEFAMALAILAIGPAINMLLQDRDLVDGFLDNRAEINRCFARLRKGAPMSETFFLSQR